MPMSPKFHINLRVLTVFLIVALPVLAVGVILVLGSGQARLRDSYGRHLADVAQQTAATVDAYIFRRILDVAVLARVPDVHKIAASENQRALNAEEVRTLDRRWMSERAVPSTPIATQLMTNAAAQFFVGIAEHDPIYREIMLTDRFGRLVAASERTSDYYQADEEWWQEAFDDGVRGRVIVSDVVWDESARVFAIDIAVPVADPATGNLVGILKTSADTREMLAAVTGLRLGSTGQAIVLREDGSIVFGRPSLRPDERPLFFAADLLRERLEAVRKVMTPEFATYFSARDSNGQTQLIGIAPSQLGRSSPKLSWLIAVYQSDLELFAPVRNQFWHLLLVLALTAIAVLVLALWYSMRLAAPPIEVAIGPEHTMPTTAQAG
jgi:Cache domain